MGNIAYYTSGPSINQPETKKRSDDEGKEGRMRVLKHETAPAITKHNEEEKGAQK